MERVVFRASGFVILSTFVIRASSFFPACSDHQSGIKNTMNDIRYGLRQLIKSPSFSGTAIFALALGIGATTAMFAVIYAFLLRPLPFSDPEKLVMLQSRSTRSGSDLGVNYLDFIDWQKQSRSFSDLAFFNLRWNGNLEPTGGATETLKTTFTTANLFNLLGVQPMLGRNLTAADDEKNAPKVMLISERLWKRSFGGNPSIIGRDVRLDGAPHTVVGVMPAGFCFPSQTDLWVPMASVFGMNDSRSWRADQAIGRLKPGATAQQAQAEMALIAERLALQYPDTNKEIGAAVVPLRDHWTGGVRFSLLLLLAGCGGLLLIACANVSQLLLARATTRERELAVRAALGASRWRLARQVLTESALLALIGSVGGAVLAYWLIDLVAASIPIELPFWIRIDVNPSVLGFTVVVSCATVLLAGSLPAWQATRAAISESLKTTGAGNTGGSGAGARSREILTAAQVAAAIVLLVGASLMLRSLLKLREVNPGFDARNVLMMEVNPTYNGDEPAQTRVDRFARLLQRISEMPGVEMVGANNSPPFVPQRPWNRTELAGEHQSVDEQSRNPVANFQTVSSHYFQAVQIPLLRGRAFDERDKLEAQPVCMISERLAMRIWPTEDALGKRVKLGKLEAGPHPDWMAVIGVVGDVRHQALEGEAGPDFYNPSTQLAWKQMHFLVRVREGLKPFSLVPALQKEIAAVAPEVGVFNFVSLGDEVNNSLWQQRLRGWLLGFFSIVALSLSAAGLYGAVAYGVAQRTREIGIRMALGATRSSVLRLVLGRGMRAVAIGLAFGIGGALVMSRILNASLFGVSGNDLVSYGAACLVLAVTATGASLIPARRASLVNPMEALRAE
jgi:putative ABC transport system permease protein